MLPFILLLAFIGFVVISSEEGGCALLVGLALLAFVASWIIGI